MQKPGLYIVSTPIGNLGDITIRALEILKNSTLILCENTRISQKLLTKYGINNKLEQYNDHSNISQRTKITDLIANGASISLISDAGTPLISDPGYKLLRELKAQGHNIEVIPGVSAPITALTISGMPSDRFLFVGFIPKTVVGKTKFFAELADINATLIFFESPNRLLNTLSAAASVFGNREACVTRELTKLYQEVKSAPLNELVDLYQQQELLGRKIKGEIVLLVSGKAAALDASGQTTERQLNAYISDCLSQGQSAKSATSNAYAKFNGWYSKKQIYQITNKIKEK